MRLITGRLDIIGKDISALYINALIKWFSFFSLLPMPLLPLNQIITFLKYFVNKYLSTLISLKKRR